MMSWGQKELIKKIKNHTSLHIRNWTLRLSSVGCIKDFWGGGSRGGFYLFCFYKCSPLCRGIFLGFWVSYTVLLIVWMTVKSCTAMEVLRCVRQGNVLDGTLSGFAHLKTHVYRTIGKGEMELVRSWRLRKLIPSWAWLKNWVLLFGGKNWIPPSPTLIFLYMKMVQFLDKRKPFFTPFSLPCYHPAAKWKKKNKWRKKERRGKRRKGWFSNPPSP